MHLKQDYIAALKEVCPIVEIHEGLPDLEAQNMTEKSEQKLLVLDDLMFEFFGSKSMINVILEKSHHASVSVVVTTQGFHQDNLRARIALRNFR